MESRARRIWLTGIFFTMVLFLANYFVYQNLVEAPTHLASVLQQHLGRQLIAVSEAALPDPDLATLQELKKREHIRTLVFQNFRNVPLRERSQLFDVIYHKSLETGIDPYLTVSVIATESSFRKNVISWAGAYGLMQLKLLTAEEVAGDLGIPWQGEESLFDPVINITLGLTYLAKLKKRFGNISDALTAYNYGPQYVVSCRRNDKALPDKYVKKIERHLKRYGLNTQEIIGQKRTT